LSKQEKTILSAVIISAFILPGFNSFYARADAVGERHNFFVDRQYDVFSRTSVPATLIVAGQHSHIYIEDAVLERYGGTANQSLMSAVSKLASDFDSTIYPANVDFWGSEPNPGIDNDPHVTILFEQLMNNTGGYTDTSNLYLSAPGRPSNEREMFFVSSGALIAGRSAVFMAHEFEHLISANQKILIHNVAEDIWLDELRAQYSVTLAGYNSPFTGSDLQSRKNDFLRNPVDSLTEWKGRTNDYAPVTLFGHYLVGRYGPAILKDTIRDRLTGIDSINAWLAGHKYQERFVDVFGDWAIANYLNAPGDLRFGYAQPDLADVKVSPIDAQILRYPLSQYSFSLKPWQAEWYKFISASSLPPEAGQNLRVGWTSGPISVMLVDDAGKVQEISNGEVIVSPQRTFTLIPYYHPYGSSAGQSEPSVDVLLNMEYTNEPPVPAVIPDGSLIRRKEESDIYVVEGKYKRYLAPGVISLYGHLDPTKAFQLEPVRFDSYLSTNYVRYINEQKVYAVWPPGEGSSGAGIASDGTKHWLHMPAQTFSETGRDWSSIFIINDLELNFYKTSSDITK